MVTIKLLNTILISFLMVAGWGCSQSLTGHLNITDPNDQTYTETSTNTDTHISTLDFEGLNSIDHITGDGFRLNWTHITGALDYIIYNTTSDTPVHVARITAPASIYDVTGLNLSTQYSFRVKVLDTTYLVDDNIKDITVTTTSATAIFNGWTHIKAVGATTPITYTELTPQSSSVTLGFESMSVSSGTIQSYNIYRATTSEAQDFNIPYDTGITISGIGARIYTDNSVTAETAYFYVVAPVVSGVVVLPSATDDQEITVYSPPNNMALVHRWAANKEMCEMMEKTPDRNNNYRCTHTGIGSSNGVYFDIGDSLLVDMFELGCNYTRPNPGTPADSCGDGTNGCLGTSSPGGLIAGNENDVFYNRASGICYINTSIGQGTTWTDANNAGLNTTQRAIISSNRPGLPPFTNVNQNRSQDTCNAFSVTGSGNKSILKRSEFVIAAAWSPLKNDGSAMDDATIADIENGTSLPSSGHCNTNSGDGLTYDDLTIPANLETLPSTSTHSSEKVITGSTATENCISRYGIQDMVGNVWEWNSDQIDGGTGVNAVANTVDNTNDDFNGLTFDNNVAPNASGYFTSTYSGNRDQLRILFPLGLPVVDDDVFTDDDGSVNWSESSIKFHSDYLYLNIIGLNAARSGGYWNHSNNAGRFLLNISDDPTYLASGIGCRCRALSPQ